ncbi:MAG: heavy-metal-associated domain-containing protein [Magnetococcales bacterium]|nr:heavy-metal-associated domain-containing protein [Magnetococcales bacterium]
MDPTLNLRHDSHPVTHTLELAGMISPESGKQVAALLRAVDGVLEVAPEWDKGRVAVTYDLWRTHIEDLEKALEAAGYPPEDDFWPRLKLDWIHFTEHNELDNLTATPRRFDHPPQFFDP